MDFFSTWEWNTYNQIVKVCTLTYISFCFHRCKITMANRIKSCRHHDCYCKPKKATHSASPPPPALDLELLQRYVRLRENGKFLNLEINCSDGSTRSVHKYVLNSLSVKLGRSIIACKYNYILNYILLINLLARVAEALKVLWNIQKLWQFLFSGPRHTAELTKNVSTSKEVHVRYTMDFLIDGQISSFCPGQHEAALLNLIISNKLTQSVKKL